MYTYRVLEVLDNPRLDGDTFDVRLSLGFGIVASFRFRLAHVDVVERGDEGGLAARDHALAWLSSALDSGSLIAETYKGTRATVGIGDGSFGRWLADFTNGAGEHLSEVMVAAGYAKTA